MEITYNTHLGLTKVPDGNNNWGEYTRDNWDAVAEVLAPDGVYFVSPNFTIANIPELDNATNRRYFDTIQGAINAHELNWDAYGAIFVYPGRYDENLTVTSAVTLHGVNALNFTVSNGGRGAVIRSTDENPCIDIQFGPGHQGHFNLVNIELNNTHTAGGTSGGTAYIKTTDQGAGNYPSFDNRVNLRNVIIRKDTIGGVHDQAFYMAPNHALYTFDCEFKTPSGSGDELPILVRLVGAAGYPANLVAAKCMFFSYFNTDALMVSADTNTITSVYDCAFPGSSTGMYADDGGTHTVEGLTGASDQTQYKNAFGINTIQWRV